MRFFFVWRRPAVSTKSFFVPRAFARAVDSHEEDHFERDVGNGSRPGRAGDDGFDLLDEHALQLCQVGPRRGAAAPPHGVGERAGRLGADVRLQKHLLERLENRFVEPEAFFDRFQEAHYPFISNVITLPCPATWIVSASSVRTNSWTCIGTFSCRNIFLAFRSKNWRKPSPACKILGK